MLLRLVLVILCFSFCLAPTLAQTAHIPTTNYSESLTQLLIEQHAIELKLNKVKSQVQNLKEKKIIADLKQLGLPQELNEPHTQSNNTDYIEHSAMILQYAEQHEQARWVTHMIIPDIQNGSVSRTNDFRIDPKVLTGTAVQEDYFLTDTLSDGTVEYDGFGYDRGHLAPSADFRWSAKALSESYYYSNMSPQLADFNRKIWAKLESYLRSYVISQQTPLYVVTLPILSDDLAHIPESINQVSIPEKFAKVAYDKTNNRAIAFIIENKFHSKKFSHYITTIDEVEALAGLDLFTNLSEEIESTVDKDAWLNTKGKNDVEPLYQPKLPRGYFNTIVGSKKKGQKIVVCGKVVNYIFSSKGHLWLDLDRTKPNDVFSIFIRKENFHNFDTQLQSLYENQNICVEGKVESYRETPHIEIDSPQNIEFYKKRK